MRISTYRFESQKPQYFATKYCKCSNFIRLKSQNFKITKGINNNGNKWQISEVWKCFAVSNSKKVSKEKTKKNKQTKKTKKQEG